MLLCKYCRENGLIEYLECVDCGACIHLQCLRGCELPGGLLGDVFFRFTCAGCNKTEADEVKRNQMPWVDAVLLTLYNLTQTCPDQSVCDYFHCNEHIVKFVDTHWETLFPTKKTRKKLCAKIKNALKGFSPKYFTCGDGLHDFPTGLTGWYKLARSDMLPNQALLDRKEKSGKRQEEETSRSRYYSREKLLSFLYDSSGNESDNVLSDLSSMRTLRSDSSSVEENTHSRPWTPPHSEKVFAEDDQANENKMEVMDYESTVDNKCEGNPSASPPSCVNIKREEDLEETDCNFEEGTLLDSKWKSEMEAETHECSTPTGLSIKNEGEGSPEDGHDATRGATVPLSEKPLGDLAICFYNQLAQIRTWLDYADDLEKSTVDDVMKCLKTINEGASILFERALEKEKLKLSIAHQKEELKFLQAQLAFVASLFPRGAPTPTQFSSTPPGPTPSSPLPETSQNPAPKSSSAKPSAVLHPRCPPSAQIPLHPGKPGPNPAPGRNQTDLLNVGKLPGGRRRGQRHQNRRGGTFSGTVTCPEAYAKRLPGNWSLLKGMTVATVCKDRTLRCSRCLLVGHRAAACRESHDRSGRCMRCSRTGHQARFCRAPYKCPVCVDFTQLHKHRLGGKKCMAQNTKK